MADYSEMVNAERVNLAESIPLPAPFVIQLETSGFCNLMCTFCPVNDREVQQYLNKTMMSPENFGLFVDQCTCFPQKIKVLRIIGNGEPTMNGHIAEYVCKAKESEAFGRIEITTNATLLTHELSDSLIEAGLDSVRISLEAIDSQRFLEIAGINIDVEKLYDNIEYFYANRGNCKIYIKTTDIALRSEDERNYFIEHWGKVCDYIFVENVSDIWPEYSPHSDVKRYGGDIVPCGEKHICIQPFELLSVAADGEVMPCCADWKRKLSLGNINNVTLASIWNGDAMRALRIKLLDNENVMPCSSCGCPSVSQREFIDLQAQAICCRLQAAK